MSVFLFLSLFLRIRGISFRACGAHSILFLHLCRTERIYIYLLCTILFVYARTLFRYPYEKSTGTKEKKNIADQPSITDKSVSFEKSVSFSDDPPDMNSPKQHSPQHAGNGYDCTFLLSIWNATGTRRFGSGTSGRIWNVRLAYKFIRILELSLGS